MNIRIDKIFFIAVLAILPGLGFCMEENSQSKFSSMFANVCHNQSLLISGGLHAGYFIARKRFPYTPLPLISSLAVGGVLREISHKYLTNAGHLHIYSKDCNSICENYENYEDLHIRKVMAEYEKKYPSYAKKYPLTSSLGQLACENPFLMSAAIHLAWWRFLSSDFKSIALEHGRRPLLTLIGISWVGTGGVLGSSSHDFLMRNMIPHGALRQCNMYCITATINEKFKEKEV